MTGSVTVSIVTWNSGRFIRKCLKHLLEQSAPAAEIIVVDNASSDETPSIVREFEGRLQFIQNRENVGFASAQNQAIRASTSDWILTLNPDVRLTRDFLHHMVEAGEMAGEIGSVSGKLLATAPDFETPANSFFDSTGIYFTISLRHLDRGSGEADTGQYDRLEYVFGVTGAAALYRRSMIDDISIGGEFFDSDFFAYREDADLAWRAQLLGWKCVYTPHAVAYHVRTVLPENRKSLPALVNMHSVKNRFLMRIKNITTGLYARCFLAVTLRDLVVIGACLAGEFKSLPAFPFVIRNFGRTWTKRRAIMRRRRVSDRYMNGWFSRKPVSYPAPALAVGVSDIEKHTQPVPGRS